MKKLLAVGMALVLSGCGGFDDMDAARLGMTGIGSTGSDNNSPDKPTEKPNWEYKSFATGDRVYSLRADNYAINFFYDPVYPSVKHIPWVQLTKTRGYDDAIEERVVIYINSSVSCMPSCDVRMSFDGNWATYKMRHSIDGVIKPIDESTEKSLFKKFTTSNRATVRLPIIGLSEPFDANFNLSGYDIKRMKFISE